MRSSSRWETISMTDSVLLRDLRVADVRSAIRDAIQSGIDTDKIADFVASVDWSGDWDTDAPIAQLLGRLENYATLFAEGDLTTAEYLARLAEMAGAPSQVRDEPADYDPDA